MATWTITRTLDVSPSPVPTVIHIKQYASDFALKFNLVSSDGSFSISSGSVYIRGTKTDGKGWQLGGSRSGNTVTFSGTHEQMQQMTAVAGENIFEVVLMISDKELPFSTFILDVQRAALDADTVKDQSSLSELKSQVIENTTLIKSGGLRVENGVLIIGG